MGRRELVGLVGSAVAWPVVVRAQHRCRQLGLLTTTKLDSGDRAAVRGMTRQTSKPTSSRQKADRQTLGAPEPWARG